MEPTVLARYFEIVRTPAFEATAKGLLTEELSRQLDVILATNPHAGVVIPDTGGVRKVRLALPGRGKSGGARVIYYPHLRRERVYLFFIYAKNERENPTEAQKHDVRKAVKMIQDEER